jgi:hypothetical protein
VTHGHPNVLFIAVDDLNYGCLGIYPDAKPPQHGSTDPAGHVVPQRSLSGSGLHPFAYCTPDWDASGHDRLLSAQGPMNRPSDVASRMAEQEHESPLCPGLKLRAPVARISPYAVGRPDPQRNMRKARRVGFMTSECPKMTVPHSKLQR